MSEGPEYLRCLASPGKECPESTVGIGGKGEEKIGGIFRAKSCTSVVIELYSSLHHPTIPPYICVCICVHICGCVGGPLQWVPAESHAAGAGLGVHLIGVSI